MIKLKAATSSRLKIEDRVRIGKTLHSGLFFQKMHNLLLFGAQVK